MCEARGTRWPEIDPSRDWLLRPGARAACSLANKRARSSSIRLRSLTSRIEAIHPRTWPRSSVSGVYTTRRVRMTAPGKGISHSNSTRLPCKTVSIYGRIVSNPLSPDDVDDGFARDLSGLTSHDLRVGPADELVSQVTTAPGEHERRLVDRPAPVRSRVRAKPPRSACAR